MIIFNPDIHSVIETIKILNKNDEVEMIDELIEEIKSSE
jgi:hypothetical protein